MRNETDDLRDEVEIVRSPSLLNKKFAEYLAPTLFMNISLALTGVMNATIVGNLLGSRALAVVNLCMPLFSLGNALFNILAIGACMQIIMNKGTMNRLGADRIFTQLVIFGLSAMVLFGLAILFLLDPLGTLFMGGANNPEMQTLVKEYMLPLAFSFPFIFVSLGGALIIRTDGHPQYGAGIILICGIGNLIANLIFIHFFQWGLAGAGMATTAGFAFGSFLVLPYFWARSRTLHFCGLGKKIFQGFGSVLITGLPTGSTNLLMFARLLLVNMMIFRLFGPNGAAAFAVCFNMLYFFNMFLLGITQTMQPISSMLFAEKDWRGMKAFIRTVLWFTVPIALIFSLFFVAAPDFWGHLFGLKGEGRDLLPSALGALAIALPFYAINCFYLSYCQSIRRPGLALLISFASSFGYIALLSPIFYFVFPDHFWSIFTVSEILASMTLFLAIVRIRFKEKISGILIKEESLPALDLSVKQNEYQAVSLSEQAIRFCLEHGIDSKRANAVGVIVEETAINIIRYSHAKNQKKSSRIILDIVMRIDKNDVIGRFRDSGIAYNPLHIADPPVNSGIGLIRALAKEVNYMRTLGFNILYFKI